MDQFILQASMNESSFQQLEIKAEAFLLYHNIPVMMDSALTLNFGGEGFHGFPRVQEFIRD